MEKQLVYLIRHGETEWSKSGQHTGLTDKPLTEKGKEEALLLKERIQSFHFGRIFTSPLQRALRTCELCGLLDRASRNADLVEWNYGDYEGLTSAEIFHTNPIWNLFKEGAPNGESIENIEKRTEHFWKSLGVINEPIAIFSSGHILRALAAKWLGLSITYGNLFVLSTASLSILGKERGRPIISLWNDTSHLQTNYKNAKM